MDDAVLDSIYIDMGVSVVNPLALYTYLVEGPDPIWA